MKGVVGRERVEFRFYLFFKTSLKEFVHRNMHGYRLLHRIYLPVKRQETQAASPTDRLLPWVL